MESKKHDLPYMPFYIGDWFKSPDIRALPLDVRMIWFEMLCLMWESKKRGYLQINGMKTDDKFIAKMLGIDVKVYKKSLKILEKFGVFSRDENGVIYSRRMVKDEEIRQKKQKAGKKGMLNRYSVSNSVITPVITPVSQSVITSSENEIDIEIENDIDINNDLNNKEEFKEKEKKEKNEEEKNKEPRVTEIFSIEKIPKTPSNKTDTNFNQQFMQMLPDEYLPTWNEYIEHQISTGMKINNHNVMSHLKAFRECFINGITPPELLEAFYLSNHKGLFFIAKKLIEDKNNERKKNNSDESSSKYLASIVARRFERNKKY